MKKYIKWTALGVALITAVLPSVSQAVALLDGFGGAAGYGNLAMSRNDDGSSNQLNLPFNINFFGSNYNKFFINNNGNITFNSALSGYTPNPFPIAARPMIAPYWADVDTRCATCGAVYVAEGQTINGQNAVVVTWHDVGYYANHSDPTNDFQLVIRDRTDTGAGNFDIDFRYNRLGWTTGDASGGGSGVGGTPAQAGFDAGNLTNFLTLPGSRTADVVNLATTSNVSAATPGLWTFAIRSGQVPDGSSASNPLMPIVAGDGSFDFNIRISTPNQRVFIDPPVAIGYVYDVQSGPNVASVLLPTDIGDNLYQLAYNDGVNNIVTSLSGGTPFNFQPGGVSHFTITGIEPSAGLDPNSPTAFVTGLTFTGTGTVQMSQTPITVDINNVPEPGIWTLFAIAFCGLGTIARRKRLAN